VNFFEWEKRYDLGIREMNVEHQGLIAQMNRLHDLNREGASHATLQAALVELERRTVEHFEHEEAYQASIDFPGLSQHKHIHIALLTQLGDHTKRFVAEGAGLSSEFFSFLKLWLSAHIAGIDLKYAVHARAPKRRIA
jgi:hemerythrin